MESCGLICHQYWLWRKEATPGGSPLPRRVQGHVALEHKGRTLSSKCPPTRPADRQGFRKEIFRPPHGGPNTRVVRGTPLLADPAPAPGGHCRPSEETGVCFNLLCAFLSLPRTSWRRYACENCSCFRHGDPSAVFLKPWKRQKERKQDAIRRWIRGLGQWLWTQWGSTEIVAWRSSLGAWGSVTSPLMTAAHDAGRVFT